MTDRVHARMVILVVLVISLVVTLAARAFSLQVLDGPRARAAAEDNRVSELAVPAVRGVVLDQRGRPLAVNRISLDLAVSRRELRRLDDRGTAVLERLGALLQVAPDVLAARLVNCGTAGARPQPDCWNGTPSADPVVARDVPATTAGLVLQAPADFPGISVRHTPTRHYPGRQLAAHALGYVAAVDARDVAADPSLAGIPARGRAGLEAQYDAALRGVGGLERITVDHAGHRESAGIVTPAVPGRSLVTTIDAQLQAVVERELAAAIDRARGSTDRVTGRPYEADGGAAVVLDVRDGAVLAIASAPTYDANVWASGISSADYAALTDEDAGQPLLNRPLQAALAPASTFKAVSTLAALEQGYSGTAALPCPSRYRVGGRWFRNFESRAHGDITFSRALEVSCDTVYYQVADELWRADGGDAPDGPPTDAIATTAEAFGFGRVTGIDLPGESAGRLASRWGKQALWEQRREDWCRRAEEGYPEVGDRARAAYLQRLAAENCADGMRWRVGDALNAAIGQGDTTATVLQVAVAYAAIANGGTVWVPQVGRALIDPGGAVVERFAPRAAGRLDVTAAHLAYVRRALVGVVESGTARGTFAGYPQAQVPVAAKTGTGEVQGRQTTSWFASFAPADEPRYAVVMMVSQGGTGSGTAGPSVRAIHEALFGVRGGVADPARSVLVGGDVAATLPVLTPDGVPSALAGTARR